MSLSVAPEPRNAELCYRSGKIMFGRNEAKKTARRIGKRDPRRSKGNVEAYLCGFCDRWHVGNRKPRVR